MSSRKSVLKFARVAGVVLALCLTMTGFVACDDGESVGELEITDLDPRAGAVAGAQPVKIIGNHFRRDIGYTIYFGTKRSQRSTILDDGTLLVATPQQDQPGPVDVIIAADNGPAFRIANGFTYEDMTGNIMENVGSATTGQGEERF